MHYRVLKAPELAGEAEVFWAPYRNPVEWREVTGSPRHREIPDHGPSAALHPATGNGPPATHVRPPNVAHRGDLVIWGSGLRTGGRM
jgi:hypothetical protein